MRDDEREDSTIYKVVVNHEEQYSIWPADRENALDGTMPERRERKGVPRIHQSLDRHAPA